MNPSTLRRLQFQYFISVGHNLRLQLFERSECPFATDSSPQFHAQHLPVKVTAKAEDVSFESSLRPADRRIATQIRHRVVPHALHHSDALVNTVLGGKTDRNR